MEASEEMEIRNSFESHRSHCFRFILVTEVEGEVNFAHLIGRRQISCRRVAETPSTKNRELWTAQATF